MPNPNSADNIARKAADRKLAASLAADAADAKAKKETAKTAKPKVGTAKDPINESRGFDPKATQIGANHREALRPQLNAAINDVQSSDKMTQEAWLKLGATLIELRSTFVKIDAETGEVVKTPLGEPALDKRAYGAWLESEGYCRGILANPNTRSAAIWMAENASKWQRVPACVKHGHPVHIQAAYGQFEAWLEKAPDSDAADFVQVKSKGEGGAAATTPATKAAFRKTFKTRLDKKLKSDGALDDGFRGDGKPWQLLVMVEELFRALSESESELLVARADAEAATATLEALKAKIKAEEHIEDGDFTVVPAPVAERPMLTYDKPEAKPVKAKPAKAAKKAKGGKAKKLKGEDAMEASKAKGAARKAANNGPIDADFTDNAPGDSI